MKHLWVVESSAGKKWRPFGAAMASAYPLKAVAKGAMQYRAKESPGLKWRVAKYARVGGNS
jgi:hypothetical protein